MEEHDKYIMVNTFKIISPDGPFIMCTFIYKGYLINIMYNSILGYIDSNYGLPEEVLIEVFKLIDSTIEEGQL